MRMMKRKKRKRSKQAQRKKARSPAMQRWPVSVPTPPSSHAFYSTWSRGIFPFTPGLVTFAGPFLLPFRAFWPLASGWNLSPAGTSLSPRPYPKVIFLIFMPPCAKGLCKATSLCWGPSRQPCQTPAPWPSLLSAPAASADGRHTPLAPTSLDLNASRGPISSSKWFSEVQRGLQSVFSTRIISLRGSHSFAISTRKSQMAVLTGIWGVMEPGPRKHATSRGGQGRFQGCPERSHALCPTPPRGGKVPVLQLKT